MIRRKIFSILCVLSIMFTMLFCVNVPVLAEGIQSWNASAGFSSVQGSGQWYYQYYYQSAFHDMTYVGDYWKGITSSSKIWMNAQVCDNLDTARVWESKYNGTINITGAVRKLAAGGNGVIATIKKNNDVLWSQTIEGTDITEYAHKILETQVAKNDRIYFILNSRTGEHYDKTFWDPTVTLTATTDPDTAVNIAAISGVTAPSRRATPVTTIETEQYTGTVAWSPAHNPFQESTAYTATITLTPKVLYTMDGVAANFFTVAGATSVSNDANSGVVTAVFPATEGNAAFDPAAKPLNLQISDMATYASTETLTWDSVLGAEGYVVYVNSREKARVSIPATSYQLTDLAPYTEYSIYVKAYDEDGGGLSEASDTLTVTTAYVTMRTVGAEEAYTTIGAALSVVNPGDVILIKDGTYIENLNVSRPGNAGQWITVMAEGTGARIQGGVRVSGSYIRLAGFKMDSNLNLTYISGRGFEVSGAHIQIVNMKIERYTHAVYGGDYLYFADNYINKCGRGIFTGSNSIYEWNEITNLDQNGYKLDCDYIRIFGHNIIVRSNHCYGTIQGPHLADSHVDFIQAYDDNKQESKNVLVENNILEGFVHQVFLLENDEFGKSGTFYISDWTVRNNVFAGFTAWAGLIGKNDEANNKSGGIPNITFENNLFYGDPNANEGKGADKGVSMSGVGGSAIFRNNIIMNVRQNAYSSQEGSVITERGNNLIYHAQQTDLAPTDVLGMDPKFIDPGKPVNGDYHLQADSPAIGFGAEVNCKYDLEGKVRPFGNGFDIGPYEFYGTKENLAPLITITGPAMYQPFAVGSEVNITANVRDDAAAVRVEYFLDGNKIGEATQQPFNFSISNIGEGVHRMYGIAYDQEGLSTQSSEVIFLGTDTPPIVVSSSWKNMSIASQQGLMMASFDVMPLYDNMDGVLGLTIGEAGAYKNIAAIMRFYTNGQIEAMNGTAYTSDNVVTYSAEKTYHVTVIVSIPGKTFSVFVKDEEGNTGVVCSNYKFRTAYNTVTALDHLSAYAEKGAFLLLGYSAETLIAAESANITEEAITMNMGDTRTLSATVLPQNATNKDLQWESSNTSVATVSANGMVTAVANGTATVTARVVGTDPVIEDTCTVTVAAVQEQGLTITAPGEVASNKNFSAIIGFNLLDAILDAELSITYNPDLFEYKGYKEIDGGLHVGGLVESQGTIKLLLGGAGPKGAITNNKPLIELKFKSKDAEGSGVFNITGATLMDVPGKTISPALANKTVRVNDIIPGDVNDDGVIDLSDMHFVSTHFWMDNSSGDWNTVKTADCNKDGHIGIEDLVYVARKILQQ